MNSRQIILRTFDGKKIDRIVFSPRLYYWYFGNKLFLKKNVEKHLKTDIPKRFLRKSQLEIYDLLEASPRYSEETLYLPIIRERLNSEAKIEIINQKGSKEGETITKYKTPLGNLTQTIAVGGGFGGHYTEFPVKTVEDIKIMKFILENTECIYFEDNYKRAEKLIGDRGIVSTYLFSSPYQRLIKTIIGFVRTTILFKRNANEIENFISFLEERDDKMYDLIAKSSLKVINFGENVDANLSPPPKFEKYLLSYYERRVKQLHRAGKYCHVHMDGSLKDLLPYLADMPFDGLEALTAKPQGDVTLEEIERAIGDKILLDGIPSILFLPEYSNNYIRNYAQKVLEIFSPNLILGVSDELSPNGDIKKVEMIAEIVKKFEP
ncbi:MAG: uroporphyrinogen decarboxylase family protein [Promethearchaeota archaeon]